jgi:ribosomal protein S18 acetylase RimI-like enzyme
VTIRKATGDDLSAILAVIATTPWNKADYVRRQIDAGNVLVACEDDRAVAFVCWNTEFFSLPFVWFVAVLPQYRRRGIANQLFDAVEARCYGHQIYSSTNLSHEGMQRLLEGRGYLGVGEIDLDPGDPEVFYRKDLNATNG